MDIFVKIFEFITSKQTHLSAKATIFLLLIISLWLINNIFGFSYYYNINKKISILKEISILHQDTTFQESTIKSLDSLETSVLERKNMINYFSDLSKNDSLSNSTIKKNTTPNNANPIRNNFWFLISSSTIYLIAIIAMPFVIFSNDDNFLSKIGTTIISIAMLSLAAWFNYWLFGFIEKPILNNWNWNYFLNFVFQIIMFTLFYFTSEKLNKSK